MRIRIDSTSYHARGVLRRDARAAKDELPEKRPVSAKHTRRWCRGKVGVEHKARCFRRHETHLHDWYDLACTACGKRLDTYWPGFGSQPGPKPAWVTE